MDRSSYCGCKGIRSCLQCEEKYNLAENNFYERIKHMPAYLYCIPCGKVHPGWNSSTTCHEGYCIPGIFIKDNFITENEEEDLIQFIDSMPWDRSQSGRRKQNFGPKCNFKEQKLKLRNFRGFPMETKFILNRFREYNLLSNFHTIEQCFMEYDPSRGSSIDPHVDDCWIWGERILTVNLLSDSVLTLTKYKGGKSRYNLKCSPYICNRNKETDKIVLRIPMPRRSLLVLYDEARYSWEHCVLREDIACRRICIAYREFTSPYLPGGLKAAEGAMILDTAKQFW